jgi:hypothetical protein
MLSAKRNETMLQGQMQGDALAEWFACACLGRGRRAPSCLYAASLRPSKSAINLDCSLPVFLTYRLYNLNCSLDYYII